MVDLSEFLVVSPFIPGIGLNIVKWNVNQPIFHLVEHTYIISVDFSCSVVCSIPSHTRTYVW